MEKLIQALQIFLKYKNVKWPTHCEHDILLITEITEDEVSGEDQAQVKELGFHWNTEYDCWASYRYGSA
jgi:hypothetical protein